MRKNKGITLVALVVTIIVLIILAGISIYLVLSENGIITRTWQAKERYLNEQIIEKNILSSYENNIDEYINQTISSDRETISSNLEILTYNFFNHNQTAITYTFTKNYKTAIAIVGASNNYSSGIGKISPTLSAGTCQYLYNNSLLRNGSYSLHGSLVKMENVIVGDKVAIECDYYTIYAIIAIQ